MDAKFFRMFKGIVATENCICDSSTTNWLELQNKGVGKKLGALLS